MLPHDRPLTEVEFVAFDLETTGLFPVVNRIVEFGAVRFRLDGRELGTWEQLGDPECPIPPEVTDIHGITDAMVRGQPTLAQALPAFLDFLGGTDAILLAHNAMFDLGFLNFAAAKTGLTRPANPVIDTLDLARTCVRGAPSCRLADLVVHLGLAESEDHRALSDSRLVRELVNSEKNSRRSCLTGGRRPSPPRRLLLPGRPDRGCLGQATAPLPITRVPEKFLGPLTKRVRAGGDGVLDWAETRNCPRNPCRICRQGPIVSRSHAIIRPGVRPDDGRTAFPAGSNSLSENRLSNSKSWRRILAS